MINSVYIKKRIRPLSILVLCQLTENEKKMPIRYDPYHAASTKIFTVWLGIDLY